MNIHVKHIGLVCRSETNSDKFYESLLGLKKIGTKTVPGSLIKKIFNRDGDLKIVNYADDHTHFEIFIDPQKSHDDTRIAHVCIEVDDLDAFVEKCVRMGVSHVRIPKPGGLLTFVRDHDGNLFEIKSSTI